MLKKWSHQITRHFSCYGTFFSKATNKNWLSNKSQHTLFPYSSVSWLFPFPFVLWLPFILSHPTPLNVGIPPGYILSPYFLLYKHYLRIWFMYSCLWGFPGCAVIKKSVCQCRRNRRQGFNPWVGKNPWSRK